MNRLIILVICMLCGSADANRKHPPLPPIKIARIHVEQHETTRTFGYHLRKGVEPNADYIKGFGSYIETNDTGNLDDDTYSFVGDGTRITSSSGAFIQIRSGMFVVNKVCKPGLVVDIVSPHRRMTSIELTSEWSEVKTAYIYEY